MKRAEMKSRSTPLRTTSTLARTAFKPANEQKPAKGAPKAKACRVCRAKFAATSPMAVVCSIQCAVVHGQAVTAKQKAKAQREQRALEKAQRLVDKARLDTFKTYPVLVREAQKVFNTFIRLRDAQQPCICCGKRFEDTSLTAGNVHAGHYRSTGSAPHLRFNEDNVHLQNAVCNLHGAGRAVDYRIGLIARIGLARVEALESNNEVVKWTHDELRAIKATYAAKVRELKRNAA